MIIVSTTLFLDVLAAKELYCFSQRTIRSHLSGCLICQKQQPNVFNILSSCLKKGLNDFVRQELTLGSTAQKQQLPVFSIYSHNILSSSNFQPLLLIRSLLVPNFTLLIPEGICRLFQIPQHPRVSSLNLKKKMSSVIFRQTTD